MILFFESEVYNKPPPNQNDEMDSNQPQESLPPEATIDETIIPIKRYYLISSMLKLQNNLSVINYENQILNMLISFVDNISYDHLKIILPKLLQLISDDLTRLQNEKKS